MLIKSIAILSVYISATLSFGYFGLVLIRRISGEASGEGRLNHWGVCFAFGSALLSTIWLFLGLVGQLRSAVVWFVLVILLALALVTLLRSVWGRPVFSLRSLASENGLDIPLFALIVAMVALAAWFAVLAYFRPPFGDADAFYMTYSKIMAATGKLEAMVGGYREFSSIGLSGELHFAALMVIGNPSLAKLFAWVAGIGMLVLLRDMIRLSGGGVVAQVVGVAILLTSSTFSDYLSDGKTDLFAALLGGGVICCVLLLQRARVSIEYVIVAGLMTGFSLSAKFSFVVAFLPAVAVLMVMRLVDWSLVGNWSEKIRLKIVGYLLIFGVSVFAALIPHLIKNHVLFGNALAPFLGMKGNWADQPTWYALSDTAWIVATYPIALVYGLYPLMGGNLSFLWLAALPLIFVLTRKDFTIKNPVMQVTLAACVGLFCWLAIKPSIFAPRYILATLVMLIPLPALAVERIWNCEKRPRVVTLGYCILIVVALGSALFTAPAGVWTALPGKVMHHIRGGAPECGLSISSYCSGLNAINDQAASGERVFLAGYYSYQLRPDLLQCINEPEDFKLFNKSTPQEVWSELYFRGYAYVAIQKATHGHFLKKLDLREVPSWFAVSVEFAESDMPVFRIRSLDKARQPDFGCIPKERAWKVLGRLS